MGKIADKYFKLDPWAIIEDGFDPEHGKVAESIFSLGNEYMGVRGYFEEGYSGARLIGSYFNGFYEGSDVFNPAVYKGFVLTDNNLTNSVDWLHVRISLDGEQLDLAKCKIENFKRTLELKTGTLTREFVWHTKSGKKLNIKFERFTSLVINNLGCQKISFEPINFSGDIKITSGLDYSIHAEGQPGSNWTCPKKEKHGEIFAALGRTKISGLYLFSSFRIGSKEKITHKTIQDEKFIGTEFALSLREGQSTSITKTAVNFAGKKEMKDADAIWKQGIALAEKYQNLDYETALKEHISYWENVWNNFDISLDGDPENQQGIRFCIFQLHQTYHGGDPNLNIGAKGLTGEAYGGKAFWDTEAYCLAFYIFNNPVAARNLLKYRYNSLPQAIARAKQLDCKGACYPIATIDGHENCGLWQHGSLQIHVSGSVAFGISQYANVTKDKEFLYKEGIEMLLEISRFYASRVQQDPDTHEYGFYGVMGVDEFHMMVNNNCFLNYMVKKSVEFTLEVLDEMKVSAPQKLKEIEDKVSLSTAEVKQWKQMAENMQLPQDKKTGVFEEHDGYFKWPHIDIHSIPVTDFPLYHNWSYDRIYRTDMIKQPDVLMMIFLYNQDFSQNIKKANYEFYEPRCIHESSLSPSVHSILASEIGKHDEASEFFGFATRLDLDDYNRNANEGLHLTSIAAAWMNIVFGFGGMRTDGELLVFTPSIPKTWKSFSFRILYQDATLNITVDKTKAHFKTDGKTVILNIYGKEYTVGSVNVSIDIPDFYIAK
jgi:maltose phosphorylase